MSNHSPGAPGGPARQEEPDIAGVVLAGGASRRMGRDKATIRLDHETLLERAARHLAEAGASRIVVATGTAGRLGPLPWEEVGDGAHAGQGPLAGLAAALTALEEHPAAVVLAVDLPFASPPLLRWLADELVVSGVAGLIPLDAVEHRPQPLHAAYHPQAIAPSLRATLGSAERRVVRALATAGAVHLDAPSHGPDWHRNANTPLDLQGLE